MEWRSLHHKSVLELFRHFSQIPHPHLQLIPVPAESPRQPQIYFCLSKFDFFEHFT